MKNKIFITDEQYVIFRIVHTNTHNLSDIGFKFCTDEDQEYISVILNGKEEFRFVNSEYKEKMEDIKKNLIEAGILK